jgi:hypothetical protein
VLALGAVFCDDVGEGFGGYGGQGLLLLAQVEGL